jgi:hypothetical protein
LPSFGQKSIFIIKGDDEVDALIRLFGGFKLTHHWNMAENARRNELRRKT